MIRQALVLLSVIFMFVLFGLGVVAAFNTAGDVTYRTAVDFFGIAFIFGILAALLSENPR